MQTDKMSKQETLDFIEYLRTKEDVLIESQLIHQRTWSKFYTTDMSRGAETLYKAVMNADSAADAYRTIAHRTGKMNSLWKTCEDLSYMFIEDLEEYLKINPEVKDDILFKRWYANGYLETRDVFTYYFPTEYIRFCHKHYNDNERRLTVTELPKAKNHRSIYTEGLDSTYKSQKKAYERRIAAGEDESKISKKRLTLGFDEASGLDAEKLVSISKFIAEQLGIDDVNICDFCSDTILVVHRENLPELPKKEEPEKDEKQSYIDKLLVETVEEITYLD